MRAWREQTPANFLFAWKASRFITHWKRLNANCDTSLQLMTTRLRALGAKCGPVLFQLPGRFKADAERLAAFLRMLPKRYCYAFEFRDASWFDEEILALLRANNVALCVSDHHQAQAPWIATARFVYVRAHGPGGRYRGSYSHAALRQWAKAIRRWQAQHKGVFVFFDHDEKSAAAGDARRLTALLSQAPRRAAAPTRNREQARKRPRLPL